jgi:hypothetical protein
MLALAAPPAADEFPLAAGLWHYGRARAFAARHREHDAGAELAALRDLVATTPSQRMMGANATVDVLRLAYALASGDAVARAGGDGTVLLREAVQRYRQLAYDEPPSWPPSPRLELGRAYLDRRRFADAAATFREELAAQPALGWALLGLRAAEAGLDHSTTELDARLKAAFHDAEHIPSLDAL